MAIDWDKVQQALKPIKDFEDVVKRMQVSFSYKFVRRQFNLSVQELLSYTQKLLGGDSKQRYTEYLASLEKVIASLERAGVRDVLDLKGRTASREKFEQFTDQTNVDAADVARLLNFLIYWFIPPEKYMGGLVRDEPEISAAIQALKEYGIKSNLDILEKASSLAGRKSLAETSGLPLRVITELVNRADFSRLPWASKATISNIIGAGYASLAGLAQANPEKLYEDFFRYGSSIGKNLKLGNEIENSYRIARIVPMIVQNEENP